MIGILKLIKSLLIGGIIFMLPIGIILIVLLKLFAFASQAAVAIRNFLLPGIEQNWVVFLIAILILSLIALAAGVVAQTRFGKSIFVWLENAILNRVPVYTMLKQSIVDVTNDEKQLAKYKNTKVVRVAFDDHEQIGFEVGRTKDGGVIVYLPGSPSAMSGSVLIVTPERITLTGLSAIEVMAGMRQLGAGISL